MGIEIPESLQWVAKWIVGAGDWPEGDETAMWRVSAAWSGMASALNDIDDDAHRTVQQALAAIDGRTHDSIAAYWDQLMGEQGAWAGLVKYLDSMADQIGDGAADIEQTKLVIIGTMVVFAIQVAPLLATAWTGISAAGAVALRVATQITIRMAIKELITRMLTRAAAKAAARAALYGAFAEALEEGGLDIGTKFLQLGTGHRDDITAKDWQDAGVAAAAGAAGGAVGAGLGNNGLLSGASDAASSRLGRAAVEGSTEAATGIAGEIAGAATAAALTDQPFNLTLDSITSSAAQGVPAGVHAAGNHHSDTDTPPPAPDMDGSDRNLPPTPTTNSSDGNPSPAPTNNDANGNPAGAPNAVQTTVAIESQGVPTNSTGNEQSSTAPSSVDSTSPASADRSPTETTQNPAAPTSGDPQAPDESAAANAASPQSQNLAADLTPHPTALPDTSFASESAVDPPEPTSTTPTAPDTPTAPAHTGDTPPPQTQSLAGVSTDTTAPTTQPTDGDVGQPVSGQNPASTTVETSTPPGDTPTTDLQHQNPAEAHGTAPSTQDPDLSSNPKNALQDSSPPTTGPPEAQPAHATPSATDNLTNPAPPKHDTAPVVDPTPSRIDSATSAPKPSNPTAVTPTPSESFTTTATPESTTTATAAATPLGTIPNTASVIPTGESAHRTTTATPDTANPPQTTTSAPSTATAQPSTVTPHATGPTPPAPTSAPVATGSVPPPATSPPATTSTPPATGPVPPAATSPPATTSAPPATGSTPPTITAAPPSAEPRVAAVSPTPPVADHARQNVATPTTTDTTRSAPAPAPDPGRPNPTGPAPSTSDAARQTSQAPTTAEPTRPAPARTPTDLPRHDTPPRTPADQPRHETRPPIDGFIAHAPDSPPQQRRPGHDEHPRQSTRQPLNPGAHQPDQARAAREHFRNQTPEAGRVTPVIVSADPFAANTPAFDVRRFPDQSISVITIRVHIDAGPYVSSQDIRNLIETAQAAADRAFNTAPRLLNGDRLLIDVVFAADPTTAHLHVTANQAPGSLNNWSVHARPETLISNLRQQLGLFPHEPGTDPALTATDLRQLSNDIAAANTPARFTGLPDTRAIDHHRLGDLEDHSYQAIVEDSLRNGDCFTIGADPRVHPYGRFVNDGGPGFPGRGNNCLDCSLSALSSFFGSPQVSLPRWPDNLPDGTIDQTSGERDGTERATDWLGGSWQNHQGMPVPDQFAELHNHVASLGPGAAALVINAWHARDPVSGNLRYEPDGRPIIDGSHATVIVYPPGATGPVWWDPQLGIASDRPSTQMINNSAQLWSMPIPPFQGASSAAAVSNQGASPTVSGTDLQSG